MSLRVRSCIRVRAAFQILLVVPLAAVPVTAAVAATYTVNNAGDVGDANPGDGICATPSVCTLRAAIIEANATAGVDTIVLQPNTTYFLQRAGNDDTGFSGDLDILDSVVIQGSGPASTHIDSFYNPFEGFDDRILEVFRCKGNSPSSGPCTAGTDNVVDISGVEIRNGQSSGNGGAISNHGVLELRGVSVTDSFANGGTGGAVFSDGPLTMRDTTLRSNAALGSQNGGGVSVSNATVTITGSTISGNQGLNGGGLYLVNATTSLVNTTISGNRASLTGGGLRTSGGSVALYNVTVTANRSNTGGNNDARGGGVFNDAASVTLHNSIISANARLSDGTLVPVQDDCAGTFESAGHNQVTAVVPGQCMINGTISGGGALMGPLQDNGGPTFTHAIGVNATAQNAGNPAGCINDVGATLNTDQRGEPRPFGPACDLGAFELGDFVFQDGFEP